MATFKTINKDLIKVLKDRGYVEVSDCYMERKFTTFFNDGDSMQLDSEYHEVKCCLDWRCLGVEEFTKLVNDQERRNDEFEMRNNYNEMLYAIDMLD